MTASCAASATAFEGTRPTAGIPPESEIMSGRDAAANRSRTALLRTPAMQSAYRSCHRSNTIRAVPMSSTSLGSVPVQAASPTAETTRRQRARPGKHNTPSA